MSHDEDAPQPARKSDITDFSIYKNFSKETKWLAKKARERSEGQNEKAPVIYLITAGAVLGSATIGDQATLEILLRACQTISQRLDAELAKGREPIPTSISWNTGHPAYRADAYRFAVTLDGKPCPPKTWLADMLAGEVHSYAINDQGQIYTDPDNPTRPKSIVHRGAVKIFLSK